MASKQFSPEGEQPVRMGWHPSQGPHPARSADEVRPARTLRVSVAPINAHTTKPRKSQARRSSAASLGPPASPAVAAARPSPGDPRSAQPNPISEAQSPGYSPPKPGRPGLRLALLGVGLILIMGALAGRLFQVQVLERDRYGSYAESQGVTARDISARRGAILDRDYNVLAISDDRPTIYADPRLVVNPSITAAALATVLDIDQTRITQRLASDRHFVYVDRQVTPAQGTRVTELELPGVGLTYESSRILPNGEQLARGVLGAVDIDQNPTAGAEVQFADELDGTDGVRVAAISRDGIPLPARTSVFEAPTPGDDVVLSLNTEIQWMVEQELMRAVVEHDAKGATAVLMEVRTGDLLAVASAQHDRETGEVTTTPHSPAYTDSFEPGSVSKAFTVAAALEEGVTTPTELINATSEYKYADKIFREPYRTVDEILTTEEVLTQSSNIGTIQLAVRIPSPTLYDYLRAFGFGRHTGKGHNPALPGETKGILQSSREWFGTRHATIAFGHGVSVTAVQLTAAYNVMAAGGEYVAPRLHLGNVDVGGRFNPIEREAPVRVLSQGTAGQMVSMLSAVVTNGTGKRAVVPGYEVAGKTGTAQKLAANGTYSEENYVSSFAGFLPANDPQLTVVVLLDEPRKEHIAGLVAAPLFAEISGKAMRILKVAPGG